MMGHSHAVSGTLVAGGAALVIPLGSLSVPELIAGIVLCTGAALLPDIDHMNATATKSFGPFTRYLIYPLVHLIFGPHRWGTHSFAFALIVGIGTQVAVISRDYLAGKIALVVILSLVLGPLVRFMKIRGIWDELACIAIIGSLIFFTDVDLSIVPIAVMIGAWTHVMGDCMTDRGCPVLWPLSKKKFTLKIFTTGKTGEKVLFWIMFILTLCAIVLHMLRFAGVVDIEVTMPDTLTDQGKSR